MLEGETARVARFRRVLFLVTRLFFEERMTRVESKDVLAELCELCNNEKRGPNVQESP